MHTTFHDDDSSKQGATKSTDTAPTATSSTSSTSSQSQHLSRQVMIKTANKNLAATRSYDYHADGKYKTTKAWDTVSDRHKKTEQAFHPPRRNIGRTNSKPKTKTRYVYYPGRYSHQIRPSSPIPLHQTLALPGCIH
jgi:hypothetical protein